MSKAVGRYHKSKDNNFLPGITAQITMQEFRLFTIYTILNTIDLYARVNKWDWIKLTDEYKTASENPYIAILRTVLHSGGVPEYNAAINVRGLELSSRDGQFYYDTWRKVKMRKGAKPKYSRKSSEKKCRTNVSFAERFYLLGDEEVDLRRRYNTELHAAIQEANLAYREIERNIRGLYCVFNKNGELVYGGDVIEKAFKNDDILDTFASGNRKRSKKPKTDSPKNKRTIELDFIHPSFLEAVKYSQEYYPSNELNSTARNYKMNNKDRMKRHVETINKAIEISSKGVEEITRHLEEDNDQNIKRLVEVIFQSKRDIEYHEAIATKRSIELNDLIECGQELKKIEGTLLNKINEIVQLANGQPIEQSTITLNSTNEFLKIIFDLNRLHKMKLTNQETLNKIYSETREMLIDDLMRRLNAMPTQALHNAAAMQQSELLEADTNSNASKTIEVVEVKSDREFKDLGDDCLQQLTN